MRKLTGLRHHVSTRWKRYILLPMVVPLFAFFLTGCTQQVAMRWSCDNPSDIVQIAWIGPNGVQGSSLAECTGTKTFNYQDWGSSHPELWVYETYNTNGYVGCVISQNGADTATGLAQGAVHCNGVG